MPPRSFPGDRCHSSLGVESSTAAQGAIAQAPIEEGAFSGHIFWTDTKSGLPPRDAFENDGHRPNIHRTRRCPLSRERLIGLPLVSRSPNRKRPGDSYDTRVTATSGRARSVANRAKSKVPASVVGHTLVRPPKPSKRTPDRNTWASEPISTRTRQY